MRLCSLAKTSEMLRLVFGEWIKDIVSCWFIRNFFPFFRSVCVRALNKSAILSAAFRWNVMTSLLRFYSTVICSRNKWQNIDAWMQTRITDLLPFVKPVLDITVVHRHRCSCCGRWYFIGVWWYSTSFDCWWWSFIQQARYPSTSWSWGVIM